MNRKGPLKNYIIVKFQNTINKKEMLKASREEKKKRSLAKKRESIRTSIRFFNHTSRR